MRSGIATTIVTAALALAAGCGSSTSSTGATTAASTARSPSSLKVSTTPRFAAPPASATPRSGVVQIAYSNIAIAPDTLTVKAGSTIVWRKYDTFQHNVTSQGGHAKLSSGNFGSGGSFRVTLTRPGLIHYLCTNHPTSMNGTIKVVS